MSKLIEEVPIASFDDFFALGSLARIEQRLTQEPVAI
jgi:histidine ammonia-lyase